MTPREQAEQMTDGIIELVECEGHATHDHDVAIDDDTRANIQQRLEVALLAAGRDAYLEIAKVAGEQVGFYGLSNWLRERAAEMTAAVHETGRSQGE